MNPFVFPDPPNAKVLEWPGAPIGAGNVITRAKARLAVRDVAIDRMEGRRDELVTSAVEHIVRHAGAEPLALCDAVIHGVRVRAITNSKHLEQFWTAHWYRPDEWRRVTGLTPPARPQVTVYAIGGVADQQEGAYYSHRTRTVVLFNTAYYGEVWSAALAAVGRLLAEERGIHSVHGACVGTRDGGVLCIGPAGTGKSAAAFGLATGDPGVRFLSHNTVHVRYTLATRDGRRMAPFEVHPGARAAGPRLPRLPVAGGAPGRGGADPRRGPRPRGSPCAALRARSRPAGRSVRLRGREGVVRPDGSRRGRARDRRRAAGLRARERARRDAGVARLPRLDPRHPRGRSPRRGGRRRVRPSMSRDEVRVRLAALLACPDARAMLDLAQTRVGGQVVTNPMEGVPLSTVVLLRRDPRDRTVLEALPLARFVERLLIGEAPDGTREVAYNAHRAASPQAERAAIDALAAETAARGGGAEAFYHAFERSPAVPPTLALEGELFRMLHRATRCYDLNAILASDPATQDPAAARTRTDALIAYAAAARGADVRLDLDGYRHALAAAPARSWSERTP